MKIFHFSNLFFDPSQLESGGMFLNTSGGWIAALLGQLLMKTEESFCCAAFASKIKKVEIYENENITCFAVPIRNGISECIKLVREWRPDLIHIHGTESVFGLLSARGLVEFPAVISIQGLLGPCSRWHNYFGNTCFSSLVKMHRWLEFPTLRGQLIEFLKLRSAANREQEIIF